MAKRRQEDVVDEDDEIIARLEKKLSRGDKKKKKTKKSSLDRELENDGFGDLLLPQEKEDPPEEKKLEPPLAEETTAKKDIYGSQEKWVPRRKRVEIVDDELSRLARNVVNKVSDATLETCAKEASQWSFPNGLVNAALVDELYGLCVTRAKKTDDVLLPTYAAFVACVSFKRDTAYVLLDKLVENYANERCAIFIARLCEIGLFGGSLALSLAEKLDDSVLAVSVLEVSYERIKADQPDRFKRFRVRGRDSERDKHAMKTLAELPKRRRNNERVLKLRSAIRRFGKLVPMNVEFDDVVSNRGQWWRVGSAWTGRGEVKKKVETTDGLEAVAKAQRMNTGGRKATFVALMGSRDTQDALIRCRDCVDVEAVAMHCCQAEHAYNPFYADFVVALYSTKRKTFDLKLACWDALKKIDSPRKGFNFAKFVASLLKANLLTLTEVFKPLDPQLTLTDTNAQCFAMILLRDFVSSETFEESLKNLKCEDSQVAAGLLAFISAKLTSTSASFEKKKQKLYQAILDP